MAKFLEDCDTFHDYFLAIVEQVLSEELTKPEAIKMLEDKYNYRKSNIKEAYTKLCTSDYCRDYIDAYVTIMKDMKASVDEDAKLRLILKRQNFVSSIIEHNLKDIQINSVQEKQSFRKSIEVQITEEIEIINALLFMELEDTITRVELYKLMTSKSSSQNEQQLNKKTDQTPVQSDISVKEKATDTWQSEVVPYGIGKKVLEADGKTIHSSSNLKDAFMFLSETFPLEQSPEFLLTHFINRRTKKPYGERYCKIIISEINGEQKEKRNKKNSTK